MRYDGDVVVSLKEGLLDPQGKAIHGALPALGWDNVHAVRVGKCIRLSIDADSREAAERQAARMAERFLANPVIEDYQVVHLVGRTGGGVAGSFTPAGGDPPS